MLPLCSRSSLAPAAARAAYIPFGVPPSPSLPQDEPPTARGRSVAPAGAAGHTAQNRRRNRARGEEPVRLAEASAGDPSPAATLSRHGHRSRRTARAPCLIRSIKISVCCKACACLEVKDTGSAAEQIKTEIVFKGKIECVSLRTNLTRCFHVIFISLILFRALGNGLERRRRTCGKLGEANQKRKLDRMKTSLYKFKNRFENMLACGMYFHNLISSSGERA